MLRSLWFAVRIGIVAIAAVWLSIRPGIVEISWLGYDLKAQAGMFFLALLAALFLVLILHRLVWTLFSLPKMLRRYRAEIQRLKGQKALAVGLTAVAAGDAKLASYQAFRARRFMPADKGLSLLLEGQAARLKGDDEAARKSFERLMENKDTAFLGLRGLLLAALDRGDSGKALSLSRQALSMHPDQPWILRMVYDLEIRHRHWKEAAGILGRAVQHQAIGKKKADSDHVAMMLLQAEEHAKKGEDSTALGSMRKALARDPASIPAALALARWYLDHDKRRAAAAVIEKSWKQSPHPDLFLLWKEAEPKSRAHDSAARMAWYERLVALRPDSAESQMAAASAAIEEKLWGTAQQYLERADNVGSSARLYRLKARLAQAQSRPEETALMLRRAEDSPPEKAWVCRETGRVYDRWLPIAEPHGSFNTIVWDYPALRHQDATDVDRTELLVMGAEGRRRLL